MSDRLIPSSCRPVAAAAAALLGLPAVALAAPPANDDCSTPTTIVGVGFFFTDTTEATMGAEGQVPTACDLAGGFGVDHDVWFCWTATCTGLVEISTCGTTQVDTRINLWSGCGCPNSAVEPLCCADDECKLQSRLVCAVECGQEYMIQIGSKVGTPGGPIEFLVDCQGECEPIPNGECEIVDGQCCAGRPSYEAPDFQLFGNGPIGAMTASPDVSGAYVLTVYDYSDFSTAIPNTNFPIARYNDPSWTGQTFGSIFGITLDPAGDIYVTPSTCYYTDITGIGGWGDVYRVDAVTGAVSVFTTSALPNTGPGLGNIVYDCENDQFFVTNMEDGKIYRLDTAGNVLSTFDHGAADDGSAGFAPLGERLWGVTVHGGRVYYGVWNEDAGNPSAALQNEVWSVDLVAGNFSGTGTLRVTVPSNPGGFYSNPVSDIRFSPDGRMFVAERSMYGETSPGAHDSRLLEFVCENGAWVQGAPYKTGVIAGERNSAGGVDVDYRPNERIWVTCDALQFAPNTIYGAQGIPDGGGDVTTSVLVDYQGNLGLQDKTLIGDIAISCVPPCGDVEVKEIDCHLDKDGGFNGTYDATITVTNNSGVPVKYLLFPSNVVPNIVVFNPPLADGSSQAVQVQLTGLVPGQVNCISVIYADEQVNECCHVEFCVEAPECDCMLFDYKDIYCDPAGGPDPQLLLGITHLAPYVAEHLFLIVESPAGVTVSPTYVDLPSIPQYGIFAIGPITITGANPGDEVCLRVTTHAEDLALCCSEVTCFTVPNCGPGFAPADLDLDGSVGFSDLLLLLAQWGPCAPPCPADLDQNGTVGFPDLLLLLGSWS